MKKRQSRIWAALAFFGLAFPILGSVAAVSQKSSTSKPTQKAPKFPADRDKAVVAVTKEFLKQVYSGKVDATLLTPAMRKKYPAAKLKSLRKELSEFGPVKSIVLVDRKTTDEKDVATLKVKLGETMFIGTMTITLDNRIDTFLLLEE